MDAVIRSYDAQIDSVDKTKRSIVAKINTASLDRFKTVIEPRGAKLDNYRKNPVVLHEHGKDPRRFTDPVGINEWIKHSGGQNPTDLLAKTRFLDDEFSQQRFEWYRDGVLNAFSIHAIPSQGSPPTKEETRSRPELTGCQFIYREWELCEYSCTSCPGNPHTLTTERALGLLAAVERGLWLPDDVKPLIEAKARTITDSLGGAAGGGTTVEPATQEPEPVNRFIRKQGEKWVVYSEAGKALGEHDDEESAKRQLAAVEAHKHDERAWIDQVGSSYTVRSPEGVSILSTLDRSIAVECIEAMERAVKFEKVHFDLVNAARLMRAENARERELIKEEATALVDLLVRGVV